MRAGNGAISSLLLLFPSFHFPKTHFYLNLDLFTSLKPHNLNPPLPSTQTLTFSLFSRPNHHSSPLFLLQLHVSSVLNRNLHTTMAESSRRDRIRALYEGVSRTPRMQAPPEPRTLADNTHSNLTTSQKRKAREYYEQGYPILYNKGIFEIFEEMLDFGVRRSMWVDLSALQTFGVYDDFIAISSRVGILEEFWNIHEETYLELTLKFISLFKLVDGPNGSLLVKYQLGEHTI